MFTALLVSWIVLVVILYDILLGTFHPAKALVLGGVVLLVGLAIARFTIRLIARPLQLLGDGIAAVIQGKLQPIRVSRTGDEIEHLGESFNKMIEALLASEDEIRQHRELLEHRIRLRTEELEATTRRALEASQSKSEFLANMSHELRTPMNGVLGMMDIVLESRLTPEQREQLETAQRCAYSLLALLNDILDLSKIEAGKMVLERIPFDARKVVEDCVKTALPRCRHKGIEIRPEIHPGVPPQIIGDPLRTRQILENLVSNAVKFTEQGGVTISVRDVSQDGALALLFEVRDTGPGISKEKLAAIFEKFTQADGSISRKYGGTGLGLAITRSLVEIHGGEITVDSEPGRGSTFAVRLPYQEAPAEARQEAHPVSPVSAGDRHAADPARTVRVLVVEDNNVNQRVVTAILKKRNWMVEIANDGREALDRLEDVPADHFSLILMDVQMPQLDGLEATRRIRQERRWDQLPIVAMTAHAMNGDRERCLQVGMNGYVSKPVQPAHLLSVLDQYIRNQVSIPKPMLPTIENALTAKLMSHDQDLASNMIQLFLQLAPERLQKLQNAAESGDTQTITQEARNIGSSAKAMSAQKLSVCARKVEKAAEAGDFTAVRAGLQAMQREILALRPHAELEV
ncbi:MAG: response regulator [Bryobacteraceae bacterium]|nr:response regulator [Bryobacteraceae bacterium]